MFHILHAATNNVQTMDSSLPRNILAVAYYISCFGLICGSLENRATCNSSHAATGGCLVVNSSPLFAAKGTNVTLHCMYHGPNDLSLSWIDPGGQLLPLVNSSGTVVIAVLTGVTLSQAGLFTCRADIRNAHSRLEKTVNVVIGDIPEPALDVRWRSYNFIVTVLWTGSPNKDTHLNTTYKVVVTVTCYGESDEISVVCAGLVHWPGQGYSCDVNNQENYVGCFYKLSVITSNEFGSRRKTIGFQPNFRTTPLPPVNLTVIPSGLRQLTAHWEPLKRSLLFSSPTYRVQYQRNGVSSARAINCTKAARCVITGLRPYTWYQVSAQVMLDAVSSPSWSSLAGPVAARTLEEKPTACPTLTSWTGRPSTNQRLIDVTVEWQLPDNATWNGRIRGVRITYYKENSGVRHTKMMNDTKRHQVELQSLEPGSYALLTQLCNTAGCCETNNVTWISPRRYSDSPPTRSLTKAIISTATILLILALLVIIAVTYRFRRKRKCCWRWTGTEVDGDEQILVSSELL